MAIVFFGLWVPCEDWDSVLCHCMSISHCVAPRNAEGAADVPSRSLCNDLERSLCLRALHARGKKTPPFCVFSDIKKEDLGKKAQFRAEHVPFYLYFEIYTIYTTIYSVISSAFLDLIQESNQQQTGTDPFFPRLLGDINSFFPHSSHKFS